MTSFSLKVIACAIMLIAHIFFLFSPHNLPIYILGRIGFPLFAFVIAVGFIHTRDVNKYLERLGIFALISQIPYSYFMWLSGDSFWDLNILFSLMLGVVALLLIESKYHIFLRTLGIVGILIFAQFAEFSYGAYGILTIVGSYLFLKGYKVWGIFLLFVLPFIETARLFSHEQYLFQFFAIFSLIPIFFYNGQKGKEISKYWFYWFYPIHLVLISLAFVFLR